MNIGKWFATGRRKGLGGRQRGTTLIFAMVILAVSAMVLAGVVMVMGALVEHTVATQNAVQRRLTLENSRVLGVQFVRQMLTANSAATINTNLGILGGLVMTNSFSGAVAWTNTVRPSFSPNDLFRPNPFSPAGDTRVGTNYYSGYSTEFVARLSDGIVTTNAWRFEARTRTPSLGYDLINLTNAGSVPNTFTSAFSVGTTNGPRLSTISGTALNGAFPPDIAPSNFLFTATNVATVVSTGTVAGEYTSVGGNVTIFLNGPNVARTFVITGSLPSLTFNYSGTSPTVPGFPLRVVCSSITGTSTVNLNAGSVRPVYLYYNNSGAVTINQTSTPRLTALFVNTSASIGSGTIQGGIRSSGAVSGGTLSILRETDPGTLDEVAIRRGWVEVYRQ